MGRVLVGTKHVADTKVGKTSKDYSVTPKKDVNLSSSEAKAVSKMQTKQRKRAKKKNNTKKSTSSKTTNTPKPTVSADPYAAAVLKENYPGEYRKVQNITYGKYKERYYESPTTKNVKPITQEIRFTGKRKLTPQSEQDFRDYQAQAWKQKKKESKTRATIQKRERSTVLRDTQAYFTEKEAIEQGKLARGKQANVVRMSIAGAAASSIGTVRAVPSLFKKETYKKGYQAVKSGKVTATTVAAGTAAAVIRNPGAFIIESAMLTKGVNVVKGAFGTAAKTSKAAKAEVPKGQEKLKSNYPETYNVFGEFSIQTVSVAKTGPALFLERMGSRPYKNMPKTIKPTVDKNIVTFGKGTSSVSSAQLQKNFNKFVEDSGFKKSELGNYEYVGYQQKTSKTPSKSTATTGKRAQASLLNPSNVLPRTTKIASKASKLVSPTTKTTFKSPKPVIKPSNLLKKGSSTPVISATGKTPTLTSGSRSRFKSGITPIIKPSIAQRPGVSQLQGQKLVAGLGLLGATVAAGSFLRPKFGGSTPKTTPKSAGFLDFPGAAYFGKKGKGRKRGGQKTRYTPSLFSSLTQFEGKPTKISVKSGLGLRPIIKK